MTLQFPLSPIAAAACTFPTPVAEQPLPERLGFVRRHSRYVDHLLKARPEIADWLETHDQRPVSADDMHRFLVERVHAQTDFDESRLQCALRQLRQRVMAHLALRDLADGAALAEIVETMTTLADVTTLFALDTLQSDLCRRYGQPTGSTGHPLHLAIIGMGKLGGRELNVSSDVDYIFVYPEEGETSGRDDGGGRIDNYDFFTRLGKKLIASLNDSTADGQVFRVDMRLRPNGDSGPLVCSSDMLENYFIAQGREWERYAWIKARVMNEADPACEPAMTTSVARPFVFRKYLDFGAINAMRALHAQIRQEVTRKDRVEHIKLGPGGIREIEFIAQVFQLIRGGRDSSLQIRPTLLVLDRLAQIGQLAPADVDALIEAYVFLRRLEHRLQYLDDAQTHMLPDSPEDRALLAESMGYVTWDALYETLNTHRAVVSQHFQAVFSDPNERDDAAPVQALWHNSCADDESGGLLESMGYREEAQLVERICRFRQSSRYQQLPASNRERLDAAACSLITLATKTPAPDAALLRGLDFLESISGRGAYLALLQQYPMALQRVADLVGASSWAAHFLSRHPLVLDELLDQRLLDAATDFAAYRTELDRALAEAHDDTEVEMNVLREMHHAQVFRLLVQDLAGLHSLERISDFLSELADIILDRTIQRVWHKLSRRHTDTPQFAVIGYGKLGGKELGYGSDLDVVYLFDDPDPDAAQTYMRLGQRLNTWLSSQTSSGIVYEIDTRLRPNGESGMLAISLDGFREYEEKSAWVWEHQALTRARFVAGDAVLGARFEAVRKDILCAKRDIEPLRSEVLAMRQKMFDAHGAVTPGFFDIKQDPGGIIDVEFIVQFLILAHAHTYPDLTENLGNIALLGMAAGHGLIPEDLAASAQTAYREYRRLQHANRLNDDPKARLPIDLTLEAHINAVIALKKLVFGL
ncbi:MAG: bifunctional [glutamate--ammonia ligase]-adenylyl-L-tyrosine phosphorylase/[glutamate--ammonia-ligase] adenylyltransferase [Rhodocyclaceae bacterium]|jgi:glutamate-ammonia-ligase adenylyltransferase|nr:bifunctional [glutamate--ammonia ligase]-adenylyl-L-tyrosine phosphorylase/[glutamate--ammonia-ligase] adenylyltransferase [Rhodocyclaceae bacterium]